MPFLKVVFHNFRNINNAEIPVPKGQVFFIGENGQGKTNFLEAIYMLCYGRSFRTKIDDNLVQHGSQEMALNADFFDQESDIHLKIKIVVSKRKKTIFVNGKLLADRRDLVRLLPCIVFSHDDLLYVTGGPEHQRAFFDQTASLLFPIYLENLQDYGKILKSRNAVLRENRLELLETFDHQLVSYGKKIVEGRRMMVDLFNKNFGLLFQTISNSQQQVQIDYKSSWEAVNDEQLLAKLIQRRSADLALKFTTSGPHRDKFRFLADDKDYVSDASTGQLRLLSLLLRLEQSRLLGERSGKKPVLLLDDVLLELDAQKRQRFLGHLPPSEQRFYTFLPDETISKNSGPDILKFIVKEGRFNEEGS